MQRLVRDHRLLPSRILFKINASLCSSSRAPYTSVMLCSSLIAFSGASGSRGTAGVALPCGGAGLADGSNAAARGMPGFGIAGAAMVRPGMAAAAVRLDGMISGAGSRRAIAGHGLPLRSADEMINGQGRCDAF